MASVEANQHELKKVTDLLKNV